MALKPRSSWGAARPGRLSNLVPSQVKGAAIHWVGNDPVHGPTPKVLQGIQRFHQRTRGWADIAYNLGVDQDGNVWELRGVDKRSAANGTNPANAAYVAIIALIGRGQVPSAAMIRGIREAVSIVRQRFPHAREVVTHSQARCGTTECPGPYMTNLVRAGQLDPVLVPRTPTPATPPTIGPGDRGQAVAAWQGTLNRVTGTRLVVDGHFGPDTVAATRNFQRFFGLPVDGVVGPKTYETMGKVAAAAGKA